MAQVQDNGVKFLPGEVIVRAKPLLYCIYSNASHRFCAACFKPPEEIWPDQECPPALKECGNCHQFKYCSKSCQVDDWKKFHKFECKIYARHTDKLQEDGPRVVLRLALMLANRPEDLTCKFKLIDGKERSFEDLKHCLNEMKRDPKNGPVIGGTFALLKSLGVPFDERTLLISLARMQINSFKIQDTYFKPIGLGVYIEASIFDHSCRSNACGVFIGSEVQVRAIRPILLNEPVTVYYIDCKFSRRERQMKLQNDYYFTCKCVRCGQEGDGGEDDSIRRELASLENQLGQLSFLASGGLSPTLWYGCYKLQKKILPLYEKIYGEFHPALTLQLLKCSKDFFWSCYTGAGPLIISDWKPLEERLSRAIQVTHGTDHPLCITYEKSKNSGRN